MLFSAISKKAPLDEIIRLVDKEGLLVTDEHGNTPLHHAVIHYPETGVLYRLTSRGLLTARNFFGNTPLHEAVLYDRPFRVIKAVFHPDADVGNNDGKTPLHIAKNTDILGYLLRFGFNPDAVDKRGCTPLHYTTSSVASDLLFTEKSVATKNKDGRYPINVGFWGRVTPRMVKHSPEEAKNTTNANGLTPLEHSLMIGSFQYVEDLITEEVLEKNKMPIYYAIDSKAPCETVKRLYREEWHKNNETLANRALLKEYPFEIVSLFLGDACRVPPHNTYTTSLSPYANEVASLVVESGKCPPEALAIAMSLPAYTDETIEKIALNGEQTVFDQRVFSEKFVLEAVKVRGIEMVKRLLNPRYLPRHRERELLKEGYSQEEIDAAFVKVTFIENVKCPVCLVELNEDECDKVKYLQCDHKVHTECFEQVKDWNFWCFCGNQHRNIQKDSLFKLLSRLMK